MPVNQRQESGKQNRMLVCSGAGQNDRYRRPQKKTAADRKTMQYMKTNKDDQAEKEEAYEKKNTQHFTYSVIDSGTDGRLRRTVGRK